MKAVRTVIVSNGVPYLQNISVEAQSTIEMKKEKIINGRSIEINNLRHKWIYVVMYHMRRIFGPKRDENGEWRRLHNEKFHSLYRSPNIVRVIKS